MAEPQFLLKTAPPRQGRHSPAVARLEHRWAEVNDRLALVVTAPQGFGKTTLLAQWRRMWLERGVSVAWITLDSQDDGSRFVALLSYALGAATGREAFAVAAAEARLHRDRNVAALTTLLAEVARLATPTVVVLDDVHRMPQEAMRGLLAYLLNNAPANLQFALGTRRPLEIDLTDLRATGRLAQFDAGDLRLRLDETLALLRTRFGRRIDVDDAARLHDVTEGWPLGLQLAISVIERATDLHEVIGQLSARRGDIHHFFFESMLSRLPPDIADFLVRTSILEVLRPDTCAAVTGNADAACLLAMLADESPVVTEGEGRQWLRLHAMAREFLLGQFDSLPVEERRACYSRAAAWHAEHGMLQDAARHALAAGDDELAASLAARCLLDVAREGRLAEARDWIRRLSPQAIARDVRLQLCIAWIKAISDDARAVLALLEKIAHHPQYDEECRYLADVVAAAAGVFRDEPGRVAAALSDWEHAPPSAEPLQVISMANSRAVLDMLSGESERARRGLSTAMRQIAREPGMRMALSFSDMLMGLSYVWEGHAARAIALLVPRLEAAETELGRRSIPAAMHAAVLSAAYLLDDQIERARAVLADRVDVIEHSGMPDPVALAYRVLGEIDLRRGEEGRAIEYFTALAEYGSTRDLPRLTMLGLAFQVRVHSVRGRVQKARELLQELEALRPVLVSPRYDVMRWHCEGMLAVAHAYMHLAEGDPDGAMATLPATSSIPARVRGGVTALTVQALHVVAAQMAGREDARSMLTELLGLAELTGLRSFVLSLHHVLPSMLARDDHARPPAVPVRSDDGAHRRPGRPDGTTVATGGLLTPKEARVVALLAGGKANKDIARALDVGEQTVKWHLKNVYQKLDAGSRKHAVDRARLLGLIDG